MNRLHYTHLYTHPIEPSLSSKDSSEYSEPYNQNVTNSKEIPLINKLENNCLAKICEELRS